jgi:protein-disulfide isomerase
VGSAAPSVSIVEYFGYNCPTCKRLVPILHELLLHDAGVALVYKDWPILGPVSVYAAHCALDARWQAKYSEVHDALIGGPRLSQTSQVDALLQAAGSDMPRLRMDLDRDAGTIDALLEHNDEEARALSLRGTPGILVARPLIPGA